MIKCKFCDGTGQYFARGEQRPCPKCLGMGESLVPIEDLTLDEIIAAKCCIKSGWRETVDGKKFVTTEWVNNNQRNKK